MKIETFDAHAARANNPDAFAFGRSAVRNQPHASSYRAHPQIVVRPNGHIRTVLASVDLDRRAINGSPGRLGNRLDRATCTDPDHGARTVDGGSVVFGNGRADQHQRDQRRASQTVNESTGPTCCGRDMECRHRACAGSEPDAANGMGNGLPDGPTAGRLGGRG